MGKAFNIRIVEKTLDIEEKMLNSILKIINYDDYSDISFYNKEIDRLRLFYNKESLLFSKIPESISVYDYIFDVLKKSSFDLKNETIITSRFRNVLYHNYLNLQYSYDNAYSADDDVFYDDLDLKHKLCIGNNLLAEYLRSFDEPINISNESVKKIFTKIKLYNIFLNKSLFEVWVNNNFDSSSITYFTDEEMCKYLNISKEHYLNLVDDIVLENCIGLLTNLLSDYKHIKKNIIVQDSFFNLKFLFKKLSTDKLLTFAEQLIDLISSSDDVDALISIFDSLKLELKNRDKIVRSAKKNDVIDKKVFDDVINLVKFEDKLFDVFMNINFSSDCCDCDELSKMLLLEKDFVNLIEDSPSLLMLTSDLFNNSIWIYLTGDVDLKASLVIQRLTKLLPIYKDINVPLSQSSDSYNFIYKNHMIRSLNDLWSLILDTRDDVLARGLEKVYMYNYFVNPSLTDDLVLMNGNHRLIFDLSSDLSGLNADEYDYDKNEQLYELGCNIIMFIIDNEDNINSVIDYAEFQFKVNELVDVISNLSSDYKKKLYRFLMNNSSVFSPLRRDLRKMFKEYGISHVKKNKY